MRNRGYWLRLFGLFIASLVVVLIVLPIGLGGLMMWGITHPGCGRQAGPEAYNLTNYEDIAFDTAQGLRLPGYFFPGSNGATVIVIPTLASDRTLHLDDVAIFSRAGFNVLTFDSRICDGAPYHSLGYQEAEDVEAAYTYLKTRPDVDMARVSVHGFSSAGATSLFSTARIPEIRAVSAKGGYHNFAEQLGVGQQGDLMTTLIRIGAEITYRLVTGQDVRVLSPLDAVREISPRPILLIYGSLEVSLPGARQMLAMADSSGGNAELWVVEGASHGNYLAIAGEVYEQRLVAFHSAALLDN
jgi:uncharacterized protein